MHSDTQNLRRIARAQRGTARLSLTGVIVGTPIMTALGEYPVEELRRGDLLMTKDAGARPVLSSAFEHLSLERQPELAPIYFEKGALGPDMPSAPLYLDPMQLVIIRHELFEMCFERREVLVAARDLAASVGAQQITGTHEVSLIFLTMDAPYLVHTENLVLALGCQDELPPRPIVSGNEVKLAMSILNNRIRHDRTHGFPLH